MPVSDGHAIESNRRTLLPIAVAGALVGAFVADVTLEPGGPRVTQWVDDLVQIAAPAAAAIACVHAASAHRGRARRSWLLLAMSALSWMAGQCAWSAYELILDTDVPFPSLADAGYLAAIPLAAAGLLAAPSAPRSFSGRLRAISDAIVIAGSFLAVSWATVLGAVFRESEGTLFERAIGLAYPLGDLAVVTLVGFVLTRALRRARAPLAIVGCGLVAMALSDSGFAYLTATGSYTTGSLIDVGWFAGYLLVAVGAIRAAEVPTGEPEVHDRPGRLAPLVPYTAFVLAVAATTIVRTRQGVVEGVVFWSVLVVIVVVATRLLLAHIENLHLTRSLEATVGNLERSNADLEQFASYASHDLQEPLNALRLYLQILGDPKRGPPDESELFFERCLDQIARMQELIHDLLAYARVGRQVERPAVVDTGSVVRRSLALLHADVEDSHASITIEELPPVTARELDLIELFRSLIHNALKFRDAKPPRIRIGGARVGETCELFVSDDGIGIDPDGPGDIFGPFIRRHTRDDYPGTGLGLSICKKIVERHGGRIWVESEPGKGATFRFTVPAADARAIA